MVFLAFHKNLPLAQLHDSAHQGQAQAVSRGSLGGIRLIEFIKNMPEVLLGQVAAAQTPSKPPDGHNGGFEFMGEDIDMETIKKNLASLIKVKTIVTMVVIAVFAVLALRGDIGPDNAMVIISMVVSFYFGTQHEKTQTENPTA